MIADKDRSGWFGASDTDRIIGPWTSDTFANWWLVKLGIRRDYFSNKYTDAGTHWEHRILESLGIPEMEYDKQILLPELRLRVNLDGNTARVNYECKTHRADKPFKIPSKYIQQMQVQMFASGLSRSRLVVYALEEEDYINYLRPIDPGRREEHTVYYDSDWINNIYLPNLTYLAERLTKGEFPDENNRIHYRRRARS